MALKVPQTVAVYSKCLVLSYALILLSFETENFVSTRTLLCKYKFLSIKGIRKQLNLNGISMHFWVSTHRLRICCTTTTYKQPCLYMFMKFK
jgi:hypothetical protein